MGDGLKNMEGISQHIRPSRQSSNSPTQPGNSARSLAKPKGGQFKSQKFGKSCPSANGQRSVYPNQSKPKGHQNPQKKGSLVDKRPPTRGFTKQTERFNQLSVEDHELQFSYDFPVTSKKDQTSLNHLLNFTFTPREHAQHVSSSRKKGVMKANSYNKELFLQANCQFVVQDGGDYAINIVDPDVIVDWELIEQVSYRNTSGSLGEREIVVGTRAHRRVRCREMPSCPICLYPPTAAQVTRCGHIYCWSCILHYLSLSEKTWRKCPICYESIYKKDLKSVMAVSEHKHSHGQQITMTLMKRTKGSVFALPKVRWVERESVPLFASDEVEMQFSKLLIASPQEILTKIMAKDRSELKGLLLEAQNDKSDEEHFVKLALEEFEKREKRLLEMCDKEPKDILVETEDCKFELGSQHLASEKPHDECPLPSDILIGDAEKSLENETMEANIIKDKNVLDETGSESSICQAESISAGQDFTKDECSRTSISSDDSVSSFKSSASSQSYYFYQAQDGQHIFLHPVNARCLIKEYGSLENCPESTSGNIVEMECYSQTEDLRQRFRYLRHLPLTCEFAICELDLKPPVLSRETLNFFNDDLKKRRVRRQKKAREEARHESKCSSQFSAFTGIKQPRRIKDAETPDLTSEQDFPQQVGSGSDVWIASSPPTSGPWSSNVADDDKSPPGPPSFAKALSAGKCSSQRPKVRTQSEGSRTDGEKCSEEEECDVVPSFQSAFTDALMVSDWNLNVKSVAQENNSGGRSKKNKRKSKEKKLLFSTGSAMKL